MLEYTGLGLIVIGWLFQFFAKNKIIQPQLLVCYAIGVSLLIILGFQSGNSCGASLNIIILLLLVGIFFKK